MLRSPTKLVANIPPGVGADSSRPYPNIFKYAYPFHRIRISTLSNTHIHVIKYTYPFHRIRISVSHFVGVYVYAGTINRPLRLLTVCDNAADGLLIMLRSPTKWAANTPPGVGADSSRPYPCIIKYAYSHHQIHISISPNTHFRLPFRGCIHICGHDKSAPTAANGLR